MVVESEARTPTNTKANVDVKVARRIFTESVGKLVPLNLIDIPGASACVVNCKIRSWFVFELSVLSQSDGLRTNECAKKIAVLPSDNTAYLSRH